MGPVVRDCLAVARMAVHKAQLGVVERCTFPAHPFVRQTDQEGDQVVPLALGELTERMGEPTQRRDVCIQAERPVQQSDWTASNAATSRC